MKLALPSYKDGRYIRRKLRIFYEANKDHNKYPDREIKELRRALKRLFQFFKLSIPNIVWYEHFGISENKTLGRCSPEGTIELLSPHNHPGHFDSWLNTFYHEVGHYVLWYDWEKKAREFARKMEVRY